MKKVTLGVGLDIGTMNLVSARSQNGELTTNKIRDAFLDLDLEAKRALKLSKVSYVETKQSLIVLGDAALNMANLFKREARRPLSRGLISAGELDAQEILGLLIQRIVGAPQVEKEHCFYSVPADPVDIEGKDTIYHREVFRKILETLGYTATPTNEALAIIYSACAAENFSGLAVSFGAGMTNVALAYQATSGMQFALARGGDWVDGQSAVAVGKTASQMCAIKEKGIDLRNPQSREQEAIVFYLRALIGNALQCIGKEFGKVRGSVDLPAPIPFVVSGGTSLALGFMALVEEELKKIGLPLEISEVRHAGNPLTAVAEGLLVLAQSEHEEEA